MMDSIKTFTLMKMALYYPRPFETVFNKERIGEQLGTEQKSPSQVTHIERRVLGCTMVTESCSIINTYVPSFYMKNLI